MSREETPPSLYSLCTIPLAAPRHFTYSGACILPCFSLISDEEPSHRGAPFPTLLRANAHTPAHLCAISPIAMHASSPAFPLFLLRNCPSAAHLSPHSSAPMPPPQRTFLHTSPHQRTPNSAPSSTHLRTFAPAPTNLCPPTPIRTRPPQRTFPHTPPHQCPHRSAPSRHFLPSQSLSELIGVNQSLSEKIRYLPISSD